MCATKTVGNPKTGVGKGDTTASVMGYSTTARTSMVLAVGTGTKTE